MYYLERCAIYYDENVKHEVNSVEWHLFLKAWEICDDNGRCHIFPSGEINSDVLYSVCEALTIVPPKQKENA